MTSTVTPAAHQMRDAMPVAANAVSPVPDSNTVSAAPQSESAVDADIVCAIVAAAAREIAGVDAEVQVRAALARGSAELSMRVPIRYPMPIWRVTTACRTHVLERMRERCGIAVRRLDIEVSELTELVR